MKSKENALLSTQEVDRLVTLVEEATRATTESPRRFIQPARGMLDRAKSRRHHLIFGRRGSGKTSLLRKAGADLSLKRIPVAFIDLETFKGHTYPDVLLSVLIETVHAFDSWLESAGRHPASKTTFWKRMFGGKPERPPLDREGVAGVRQKLGEWRRELTNLLHAEDKAAIKSTVTRAQTTTSGHYGEAQLSAGGSTLGGGGSESRTTGAESQVVEESKRRKLDFLHRKIIDLQKLFQSIVELSDVDAYIFLDDLYHITKSDQAQVIDYFHRILKGRSAWLKVGTIRHRTEWYHHGDPPIGMKLGDDCDDIDLDITLTRLRLRPTSGVSARGCFEE